MYYNISVYIYDHDYDVDFHLMVMLRSTTGPYGRPVRSRIWEDDIFTPPRLYGR